MTLTDGDGKVWFLELDPSEFMKIQAKTEDDPDSSSDIFRIRIPGYNSDEMSGTGKFWDAAGASEGYKPDKINRQMVITLEMTS